MTPACDDLVQVSDGLATLGERQLLVLRRLDDAIVAHAKHCGATQVEFPALSPIAMLEHIDYFVNFPHLGLAAAPLRADSLAGMASRARSPAHSISSTALADPQYLLPSAACYPTYAYLAARELTSPVRVTTRQRCFRNETSYDGLARLWSFTMREIIFVGPHDETKEFLAGNRDWILRFAEAAGVPLTVQIATDPFFEPSGDRARMQRLFPVKEELTYGGEVAVASVNFHRNFFAERFDIRTHDRQHAFSGCVAFGLERWLHALKSRYQNDYDAMLQAIGSGTESAVR